MEMERANVSSSDKLVKGEEASKTLPDELVEKIVAMLPFPSIFKARGLSRSWLAKFSLISSQDDESKKLVATSFQKQVSERSKNWDTFCLTFACDEDGSIGYNRSSKIWQLLPPVSFLPDDLFLDSPRQCPPKPEMWIEGSLFYGFARKQTQVYVANILTRTWKELPPRPHAETQIFSSKMVTNLSAGTYKLILVCIGDRPGKLTAYSIDIYDSESNAWSSKDLDPSINFYAGPSSAAYVNGVVYFVEVINPQHLLAFNVEEGTMQELSLSPDWGPMEKGVINLLVCNGNRLMVVTRGFYTETLQVYEVDLGSLELMELADYFPAIGRRKNVGKEYSHPVSEGNCILFRQECGSEVLVYNVQENEWSCFPVPGAPGTHKTYKWIVSSFQPGLSPFIAI